MIKKIAAVALMWVIALYGAHAAALWFDGDAASGGPTRGHAEDISCTRNWWAFGLLWRCEATIVANDGKRHPFSSKNSLLTPSDVGNQVPMTTNWVRTGGRSSRATEEWGLAERVEPNKAGHVGGLMGFPALALFLTFRVFPDRKLPVMPWRLPADRVDTRFLR